MVIVRDNFGILQFFKIQKMYFCEKKMNEMVWIRLNFIVLVMV